VAVKGEMLAGFCAVVALRVCVNSKFAPLRVVVMSIVLNVQC